MQTNAARREGRHAHSLAARTSTTWWACILLASLGCGPCGSRGATTSGQAEQRAGAAEAHKDPNATNELRQAVARTETEACDTDHRGCRQAPSFQPGYGQHAREADQRTAVYLRHVANRIESSHAAPARHWRAIAQMHEEHHDQAEHHDPILADDSPLRGAISMRGYRSPVSTTPQGYGIYLPKHYDPNKTWPLYVALHGGSSNGNLFLGVVLGNNMDWKTYKAHLWDAYQPRWHPDWIVVAPDGFGQIMWRWMGERDVLDVIEDVSARFRVDPNRVVLGGLSNGGVGAYAIGARHASRFAAVQAMAGAPSWLQYAGGRKSEHELRVIRPWSGIDLLQNTANTHFESFHGRTDTGPMRPHFLDDYLQRVTSLGLPNVHTWFAAGHDILYLSHRHGKVYERLKAYRRNPSPSTVHLVSGDYRANRQHWLEVTRIQDYPSLATLHGEVRDHALHVRTSGNVRSFLVHADQLPWFASAPNAATGGRGDDQPGSSDGDVKGNNQPREIFVNDLRVHRLMPGERPPLLSFVRRDLGAASAAARATEMDETGSNAAGNAGKSGAPTSEDSRNRAGSLPPTSLPPTSLPPTSLPPTSLPSAKGGPEGGAGTGPERWEVHPGFVTRTTDGPSDVRTPGNRASADSRSADNTTTRNKPHEGKPGIKNGGAAHPEHGESSEASVSRGLEKRPGLSGPITDAYYGRVVHVYGTANPRHVDALRDIAKRGSRGWPLWLWDLHQEVMADSEVTDEVMQHAHLVIYGTASDNKLLNKLWAALPVRVAAAKASPETSESDRGARDMVTLRLGTRTWSASSERDAVGARCIYPNPLAPSRYVILQVGTHVRAVAHGHNLPDFLPDYVVFRADALKTRPRLTQRSAPLAEGYFDDAWRLPATILRGAAAE